MTLTVESESTQTAVINTEHTLAAPTSGGVRVLRVDLNALVAGDLVTLRIKTKVRSTGTILDQYELAFAGPTDSFIFESVPVTGDLGATFTLQQTAGTARSFDWKVLTWLLPITESEATQTAVVGTEHTLASPTTNKTRVLRVDLSNMVNGDAVELRIKTKVRSTGTIRDQYYVTYAHAMDAPIVESVPIAGDQGATFTLKQVSGTARNFDWKVLTLD